MAAGRGVDEEKQSSAACKNCFSAFGQACVKLKGQNLVQNRPIVEMFCSGGVH